MIRALSILLAFFAVHTAQAQDRLVLYNDPWPPFIIEGEEVGTAEALVCEALERAGWPCEVDIRDWDSVLYGARDGTVAGTAAIWFEEGRAETWVYSRPYLTNRIVAVLDASSNRTVRSLGQLEGLKVALASGYAYGNEIDAAKLTFDVVDVVGDVAAMEALAAGEAEVALVDELVAKDLIESGGYRARVEPGHLAYRELYFAMSRLHPQSTEIVSDFNASYEEMIKDGTVNDILQVDWLATDLEGDGKIDMVLRSGASLDGLADPSIQGTAYALGQGDYDMMNNPEREDETFNYRVEGESHNSVESALSSAFSKEALCTSDDWGRLYDCKIPITEWD